MSLFATSHKVVCVFCKLSRRVYKKREVSILDVSVLLFVTGLFAFLIWGGPDLRSLIFFMTLAFTLQIFVRMRWRESVKCPHCGFDPVLYKENSEQAALKVKDFMDIRKNNPKYLLKPQPKIKPLIVKAEHSMLPIVALQNETLPPEEIERPLDII